MKKFRVNDDSLLHLSAYSLSLFLLVLLFSCTSYEKSKIRARHNIQLDGVQETIFTHSVYRYICGADSVAGIYNISFPSPMPEMILSDVMTFMEKQREYDFICEAVMNETNTLLCYSHQGSYHLAIVDSEGEILKNGKYLGRFPKIFHGNDKVLLSPVSASEYLSYWEEQPVTHYDGALSDESNFLILKWTVK